MLFRSIEALVQVVRSVLCKLVHLRDNRRRSSIGCDSSISENLRFLNEERKDITKKTLKASDGSV